MSTWSWSSVSAWGDRPHPCRVAWNGIATLSQITKAVISLKKEHHSLRGAHNSRNIINTSCKHSLGITCLTHPDLIFFPSLQPNKLKSFISHYSKIFYSLSCSMTLQSCLTFWDLLPERLHVFKCLTISNQGTLIESTFLLWLKPFKQWIYVRSPAAQQLIILTSVGVYLWIRATIPHKSQVCSAQKISLPTG